MSLATPGQRSPPLAGDGLVQVRVLAFSPLRQYCEEQEDQPDHADQLPFTAPTMGNNLRGNAGSQMKNQKQRKCNLRTRNIRKKGTAFRQHQNCYYKIAVK